MPEQPRASTPAESATQEARKAHQAFLEQVEPHRAELWRYCRDLCRSPWDAEDLLQETLTRAYVKLPLLWGAVDLPSYLRRMARNVHVSDRRRGSSVETAPLPDDCPASDAGDIQDMMAGAVLADFLARLSTRQAALLLCSLAGYSGKEMAIRLGMTEGSVRTELSRARSRLMRGAVGAEPSDGHRRTVESFVAAYNARDLESLSALLAQHVRATIVGVAEEEGVAEVLANSIADDFSRTGWRASVAELFGERLVAVSTGRELTQLIRLGTLGERVEEIRTYYFCPEVLAETAPLLDLKAADHGYEYRLD